MTKPAWADPLSAAKIAPIEDVYAAEAWWHASAGDCLEKMKAMPDDAVDLVVTSPPYEDKRQYEELMFDKTGQAWVDWCLPRYLECVRVSRGLVCWVVQGKTKDFRWSGVPMLLGADLIRAGVNMRCPPLYTKSAGRFGSGGPDFLRNDYEFVLCSSKVWTNAKGKKTGRLRWSDNTAMGKPPKYPPGGKPSFRKADGSRVVNQNYTPPAIANPGDLIFCKTGGGHLGDDLAHKGEAPFPEYLVERLVRAFCKPGGIVLDPFCGTGTTVKVAVSCFRRAIGFDLRPSQVRTTWLRASRAVQMWHPERLKEYRETGEINVPDGIDRAKDAVPA